MNALDYADPSITEGSHQRKLSVPNMSVQHLSIRSMAVCLTAGFFSLGCQDLAQNESGAMVDTHTATPNPSDLGSDLSDGAPDGSTHVTTDGALDGSTHVTTDGALDGGLDGGQPPTRLPGRVGIGGLSSPSNVTAAMDRVAMPWATIRPIYGDDGTLNMDPVLDAIDCLVMPGGGDIDPAVYGETPHPSVSLISPGRAELDFALVRGALDRRMPILGLCLGAQEINVILGGRLVQDIPSEVADHLNHRSNHSIQIVPGTMMDSIYSSPTLEIVSRHHQAAENGDGLGAGLRVAAWSADGVVEAIEAADRQAYPFLFGTQYHPEAQLDGQAHDGLWQAFAEACAAYRAAHPGRPDLPDQSENNLPCHSDVGPGVCLQVHGCAASEGTSSPGFCPGPADVQCCAELGCTVGGGHRGHCFAAELCRQRDHIPESGSCPGNQDVQCCLQDVDCRLADGTPGSCLQTLACDAMDGRREAGHCPGSADIQCCTVPS
jgi:putative glutamine amidotransferase